MSWLRSAPLACLLLGVSLHKAHCLLQRAHPGWTLALWQRLSVLQPGVEDCSIEILACTRTWHSPAFFWHVQALKH